MAEDRYALWLGLTNFSAATTLAPSRARHLRVSPRSPSRRGSSRWFAVYFNRRFWIPRLKHAHARKFACPPCLDRILEYWREDVIARRIAVPFRGDPKHLRLWPNPSTKRCCSLATTLSDSIPAASLPASSPPTHLQELSDRVRAYVEAASSVMTARKLPLKYQRRCDRFRVNLTRALGL